ncbi:glycine betaine/L-proline ABC transporter ATP-binding protein ProV [Thiohalophilus sp.]|uniref:glycine betaine/L-proline ABC transporter ATP-binding protein ProV n=1 Tax=Thiohalophilus sp. TaxID=3028392 RepID=UPI002ACD73C6|nr:glycine betaine/L-proline ABC transporter ATP-binding protein ProV [Thiohalophilus sp.]MDZ7663369.1 glycine betaine/L-proline ABC transporter ATP-binding protein ProV [Thiohalophilus sp.]
MTDQIVVKNLYKIFGPQPERARQLIEEGLDKDAIFERTGSTVGVRDASFSIRAGEVFVIMGLSGSGKSTLVRMLNRLIEPTSGEVLINDRDIVQMNRAELIDLRRRDIAMVFQSFALLPHLSVLENAAFGLEIAGANQSERDKRAMDALEQVGLHGNANSYPDELSGGMQQRVGLARALATEPTILLMDEAFSALDPLIRREMQEELLKLQQQQARTVVFISHDLDEAMRIGDRIAMMEGGQVVQVGTPREILDNPATEYIRNFFQDVDLAQVYTAGDIARAPETLFRLEEQHDAQQLLQALARQQHEYAYLIDSEQRFLGIASRKTLQHSDGPIESACLQRPRTLRHTTRLNNVLGRVAGTPYPVPVLGRNDQFLGVVSRAHLLETLEKSDT